MGQKLLKALVLAFAVAAVLVPWTPVSALDPGTRGSITVKNLTNRWATVDIEVTSDGNPNWARLAVFCLKSGESMQSWSHTDLFRVRAELRNHINCRTPNIIAIVRSKSQRLAISADNVVTIEGANYEFSIVTSHR